jgi:hypothetical protein
MDIFFRDTLYHLHMCLTWPSFRLCCVQKLLLLLQLSKLLSVCSDRIYLYCICNDHNHFDNRPCHYYKYKLRLALRLWFHNEILAESNLVSDVITSI